MLGADEVLFGKHRELRYLPKQIASFLHEFRVDDFFSLGLLLLPSHRSQSDAHSIMMLQQLDIGRLLRRITVMMC